MRGIRAVGPRLAGVITGKWSAWLVLVLTAIASAGALMFGGEARSSTDSTAALPSDAQSAQVAELQRRLPSGQQNPALVVYSRDDAPLNPADREAIAAVGETFTQWAVNGQVSPPVFADDGSAALIAVPLPSDSGYERNGEVIDQLRAASRNDLPDGLNAQVTGGAGFSADVAGSFAGANTRLLLVTVAVVAVLLIVTYRSPWLWLVPLTVVGTADLVSNSMIAVVSRAIDMNINASTTGIVDVLVFGAGTNYALLLIARYREELRRNADRRQAMRRALGSAGPAIAASAATVALSLLTLVAAVLANERAIGVAGAVGITVAALYGLVVLPAALTVCGRGLFWPFVPRPGQPEPTRTGVWARVGTFVSRRPVAILTGTLVLLALLASGLHDARLGLSRTEQFRVQAESIDGLQTLSRHFPAGQADPTVVLADETAADTVLTVAADTPGVVTIRPADRGEGLVLFDVVLAAEPDSADSYQTIRDLRERLAEVPEADALVGGSVAANLDSRDAAIRDLKVVVPLILAVVLLVLILLLRSLLAPLILVTSVVATFFAALGAGNFLFTGWLGYGGLDTSVPLLSFLFLVALGVDYNIFLTTRAREESRDGDTRQGIRTALAVTGGVITSAGILLAAVFAVLGVLPLVTLTEIGVIVGIGVLLDTLLVRTLLVPSIVMLLGRHFWWPSRLARHPAGPAPAPVATAPAVAVTPAGRATRDRTAPRS